MELALTSTHGVQRDELEELLERDRGRLVRIAWRILGDRDEAEDVVIILALLIGGCLAGVAAVVGMALPTAVIGGAVDLSRAAGGECCTPDQATEACCTSDPTKSGSAG